MPKTPSERRPGVWGWLAYYWPSIRKVLLVVFVVSVVVMLGFLARDVDWPEVWTALRNTKPTVMVWAAGFTALSYFFYSLYDVLGRIYTRQSLGNLKVMLICAVSYAFNLSLGSFVGGMGFRYRLYSRAGLKGSTTTRILGLSLATNWMGYFLLGGVIFASGIVQMPQGWEVGTGALRLIGVALVAVAVGFWAMCAFSTRREWTIKGHAIVLPSGRMAAMEIALGMASWLSIGAILYVLFEQRVDFFLLLGVFLLSGIAGAFAHIPGGLGVIEAVFVALLSSKVPTSQILGALVAYRALYYLAPLLLATLGYLALEASLKRSDAARQPEDGEEKGKGGSAVKS